MDRKTQQLWDEQNLILHLIKENNRLSSEPQYRFNWVGNEDGSVHLEIMRVVEHGWIIKYSKIFS